ncbi:MAG: LLM class flavin-dependent oxidoreductase [Dehalococcoidia bacterium]|nr:LLM class flavin-dependent oxidoreductase [Dehalococcoidia bacterium]MSQ17697.1 LLM class flavin-dependent oxidoreductase [Dehalococcoidia bacterium]
MKFGLFQSVQLPEPGAQAKYYREALDQVLRAEQLGFNSVWVTEHHFSRHGIVSATMSFLAYLAGVTSTIRLGTAVAVLPFHNPIQLAEEAATVDLLSNGRLDFGVGRGYQWSEFHKLNVPMDEASRRFEEAMDVITKAWTSPEPFDHRGEFWSFNDMTVHPKPVQQPHPPVWVAASSPASMERVVRNNWNLLIGQGETLTHVAEQAEKFRALLGEAGFSYSSDRVVAARAMYTAPSREQARRDTEAPFMWFKQTGQEVAAPPDHRVELLPEDYKEYRRRFAGGAGASYDAMLDSVTLFGTPEVVSERIAGLREAGVENLIFFVNFGGIENQKVMDSLELFAAEVMPQFKE